MAVTEPDSAPTAPAQMPQADTPGPADVPYGGSDQQPEPPDYSIPDLGPDTPGPHVLAPSPGHEPEAPLAAPNPNPYDAGAPDPVYTGGDADAGGRDTVAGTVAEAVHNAEARFGELQSDTYGQGSMIGDAMDLPAESTTGADGGAYYDPPRDYGD